MTPVTLSLELLLALGVQLVVIVSFLVWLKADVRQVRTEGKDRAREIHQLREKLGLEGDAPAAFVSTEICELRESAMGAKIEAGVAGLGQRVDALTESLRDLTRQVQYRNAVKPPG